MTWIEKTTKFILTIIVTILTFGAFIEFYKICQGTGTWWNGFALKWGIALIIYGLISLCLMILITLLIWNSFYYSNLLSQFCHFRNSIGNIKWLLAIISFVFPIYFYQYTIWGAIFCRPFFRIFLWLISVFLTAIFIEKNNQILSWSTLIVVLLLSSIFITTAYFLRDVVDYPFSLTWSEGNRLWDYSMLFGRYRYKLSTSSNLAVHLDIGRQFVGGLPFLYPRLTILQERLWLACINLFSYFILGLILFKNPFSHDKLSWFLAAGFGLIFLMQGPIHTPLIIAAILVALAWEKPLWLSSILIFIAGYIAQVSRFTWMFAPAMWGILLEFSGTKSGQGKLSKKIWFRSTIIGIAGLFGGVIVPFFIKLLKKIQITEPYSSSNIQGGLYYQQPLLWYRLLPNATYHPGILLGLLIAILPLVILLIILITEKIWIPHILQRVYVFLSLLAFLVVGLIVSTKIGGGGDLHNLDMLLLGLLFCAAIAWRYGGEIWLKNNLVKNKKINYLVALLAIIPTIPYLIGLYPVSFAKNIGWVATLADKNPNSLITLPTKETTQNALKQLQTEINKAEKNGEILFMDQRQLLTFGYIKNVELIPEYEKKVMIDQAMARNARYFLPFYQDLAKQRFSLIISFPQSVSIREREYDFSEENNVWRKWVATPLLCYYTPLITFPEVKVQLLIPVKKPKDCSSDLPVSINP